MKTILKIAAPALILIGVVVLLVLHLLHFTFLNVLLIIPLLLILAGAVCHIWGVKLESDY